MRMGTRRDSARIAEGYADEQLSKRACRGDETLSLDAAILERSGFGGIDMTAAIRRAYDRCHEVNEARPARSSAAWWMSRSERMLS